MSTKIVVGVDQIGFLNLVENIILPLSKLESPPGPLSAVFHSDILPCAFGSITVPFSV